MSNGVMEVVMDAVRDARIMIVDDQEANLRLLTALLASDGYHHVSATTRSPDALALFRATEPDLVLLDYRMPELDGIQLLGQLRCTDAGGAFLPIVMLTGEGSEDVKSGALAAGASDFLTKPFGRTEVLLRLRNLLETRLLSLRQQRQNEELELRVRERTAELEESRYELLARLARAAEYRDDATGQHAQRVGATTARLARRLGHAEDDVELLRRAALLHDVGKIGIADEVLLKPGRFTPEEFERMKEHTAIGAELLSGSRSAVLRLGEVVARTHHERWDGGGYGHALCGEAIPLAGRIVAVADVFDALTAARPYKTAWTVEAAIAEIGAQRGRQFDPQVVDAFLAVLGGADTHECAEQRASPDHRHEATGRQTGHPAAAPAAPAVPATGGTCETAEGGRPVAVAGTEAGPARAAPPRGDRTNGALLRLIDELGAENEALRRASGTDALTGLANRRAFDDALARECLRAARHRAPLSVLLLDVDAFKATNDALGHRAGDAALRGVAAAAGAVALRPVDLVARYGGDEFAVLLPDTDTAGALAVAETIRHDVEAGRQYAGEPPVTVTVSAGAATLVPAGGDDAATLLVQADAALYAAKRAGRNRVAAFGQHCSGPAAALAASGSQLRSARAHWEPSSPLRPDHV